jgi:hypothetical protein
MNQLELTAYPCSPGFKEKSGCSQLAAARVNRDNIIRLAHHSLYNCPGTADEVARRLHLSILSVRPRCSELFALGIIRKTQERRLNAISGASAVVYESVIHPNQANYDKKNLYAIQ